MKFSENDVDLGREVMKGMIYSEVMKRKPFFDALNIRCEAEEIKSTLRNMPHEEFDSLLRHIVNFGDESSGGKSETFIIRFGGSE